MSVVKNKISYFTESVRNSLLEKNYYAALSMTLILPDICSKLEFPNISTNKRYPAWFDKYVGEKYISHIGPIEMKHVFLSGQDAYALRCSFLHQGESNITMQYARESLERFEFIEPPSRGTFHKNQFNNTLQLQVDKFCEDICQGVDIWLNENQNQHDINSRALNIMQINSFLF